MRLRKRKLPPHEQVLAEIAVLEQDLAPELGLELPVPPPVPAVAPKPAPLPARPMKRAPAHVEKGEIIIGMPVTHMGSAYFAGSMGNIPVAAPKTIWIEPGYKKSERVHRRHREETA